MDKMKLNLELEFHEIGYIVVALNELVKNLDERFSKDSTECLLLKKKIQDKLTKARDQLYGKNAGGYVTEESDSKIINNAMDSAFGDLLDRRLKKENKNEV